MALQSPQASVDGGVVCAIIGLPEHGVERSGRRRFSAGEWAKGVGASDIMLKGIVGRVKELTGIYGAGFARESVLGVLLPFGFVVGIGGLGALLVWLANRG